MLSWCVGLCAAGASRQAVTGRRAGRRRHAPRPHLHLAALSTRLAALVARALVQLVALLCAVLARPAAQRRAHPKRSHPLPRFASRAACDRLGSSTRLSSATLRACTAHRVCRSACLWRARGRDDSARPPACPSLLSSSPSPPHDSLDSPRPSVRTTSKHPLDGLVPSELLPPRLIWLEAARPSADVLLVLSLRPLASQPPLAQHQQDAQGYVPSLSSSLPTLPLRRADPVLPPPRRTSVLLARPPSPVRPSSAPSPLAPPAIYLAPRQRLGSVRAASKTKSSPTSSTDGKTTWKEFMSRRTAELKEEEPNQVRLLSLQVVTVP